MALSATSLALPTSRKASQASLVHVQIDPGHTSQKVDEGYVIVDTENNEITLQLIDRAALVPVRELSLPIVDIIPERGCSGTIYVAKIDHRPADGSLNKIQVKDLSTMLCKIAVPADRMTIVDWTTITSGFSPVGVETFKSQLHGEQLR